MARTRRDLSEEQLRKPKWKACRLSIGCGGNRGFEGRLYRHSQDWYYPHEVRWDNDPASTPLQLRIRDGGNVCFQELRAPELVEKQEKRGEVAVMSDIILTTRFQSTGPHSRGAVVVKSKPPQVDRLINIHRDHGEEFALTGRRRSQGKSDSATRGQTELRCGKPILAPWLYDSGFETQFPFDPPLRLVLYDSALRLLADRLHDSPLRNPYQTGRLAASPTNVTVCDRGNSQSDRAITSAFTEF